MWDDPPWDLYSPNVASLWFGFQWSSVLSQGLQWPWFCAARHHVAGDAPDSLPLWRFPRKWPHKQWKKHGERTVGQMRFFLISSTEALAPLVFYSTAWIEGSQYHGLSTLTHQLILFFGVRSWSPGASGRRAPCPPPGQVVRPSSRWETRRRAAKLRGGSASDQLDLIYIYIAIVIWILNCLCWNMNRPYFLLTILLCRENDMRTTWHRVFHGAWRRDLLNRGVRETTLRWSVAQMMNPKHIELMCVWMDGVKTINEGRLYIQPWHYLDLWCIKHNQK